MIMLKLILFFVLIFGGIFAAIAITPNIKNDYLKCLFIVLMIVLMGGLSIPLIC